MLLLTILKIKNKKSDQTFETIILIRQLKNRIY